MNDGVPVWKVSMGNDTFAYAIRSDRGALSLGSAHAAIVSRAEWDVISVMGEPSPLLGTWYVTTVDIGRLITKRADTP